MTRVVHVIPTLNPLHGGTTAALDGLARAQAAAGLQVGVVATFSEPDEASVAPGLEAAGVSVESIGPTRGALRRHPRLAKTLKARVADADVLHLHGLWEEPQWLAAAAAAAAAMPFVVSPHGMLDAWSLTQKPLKKRLYRLWRLDRLLKRAAALHLTTEEESQSVARLGFATPRIVVPLGLDLHEFDPLPEPGRFRERHPEVGRDPLLLFLSRLHPKKGLELLIPAFAALARSGGRLETTGHRLVIAGPPESDAYLAALTRLAADSGARDRIHLVGNQHGPERVEAMADADLFVLPSYQENFGIVVVEAAAAGLPLVVSEHVNLASFVERAAIGEVVPQDADRLAEALANVAVRADRAALGERARAATFAEFDWNAIGPRWAGVYERVLAGGSA